MEGTGESPDISEPASGGQNVIAPLLPAREGLNEAWAVKHRDMHERVRKTLLALPINFKAEIEVAGMDATDLFGLNSVLGSAIERHVVETLNELRSIWDPDGAYATYSFVRFPQSFPDVRLVDKSESGAEPVLMGIELKGWFAFSKEKEPSFRFLATPLSCARQDLLVVVPWILNNVLSGKPRILMPFIEEARYAAQLRNYHWTWIRGNGQSADQVVLSSHATPYPSKTAAASDKAAQDKGNNFGRIARTNLLSEFTARTLENESAGIPIKHWVQFLSAFTESADEPQRKISSLVSQIKKEHGISGADLEQTTRFLAALLEAAQDKRE